MGLQQRALNKSEFKGGLNLALGLLSSISYGFHERTLFQSSHTKPSFDDAKLTIKTLAS